MDALGWAQVVVPTVTGLGVAWIGATAAVRERRMKTIESELDRVRRRSHDSAGAVQGLPVTLRAHFVDRREWEQAQKAGDDIHHDHARRISDLENGR